MSEGAKEVVRYLAHFSSSVSTFPTAIEIKRDNFRCVLSRRAMFNRFYDDEWPSRVDIEDVAEVEAIARQYDVNPVWIIDHSAITPSLIEAMQQHQFVLHSEWIGMEHSLETIHDVPLPEGIRVERITDDSIRTWSEVCGEVELYSPEQFETFTELFVRLGSGDPGWTHFVAIERGRAVATASLLRIDELAAIDWVHNVPEARGKGIAAHLVGRLLEEAAGRGCRRVVLTSTAMGEKVYRRAGFTECSRVSSFRLASPSAAVSS